MAESTRPFHPLDVENNRRYTVNQEFAPQIIRHEQWEFTIHDWKGYIRITEDGPHSFKIKADDNGYIMVKGVKVVELKGCNSSTEKEGVIELKKGFHYVEIHHENLTLSLEKPNAWGWEEFIPSLDGEPLVLRKIDEPKNLWKKEDAKRLLECYKPVGYQRQDDQGNVQSSEDIYALIGGWLYDENHASNPDYMMSCALRLSIALSCYGIDLKGIAGSTGIGENGNFSVLNGKKHVIISASRMTAYLRQLLGEPDYPNESEENGYYTPQEGDIGILGDSGHVGMFPGSDLNVGAYNGEPVWLLNRDTLGDPQ